MSTSASARRDAASATVQQLRLRLLDLTGRNPLVTLTTAAATASKVFV